MFKKSYPAQNSRQFKRFRADYLVKYHLAGSNEAPAVSNIKDVSAGGVKFWSDQFLPLGTLLKLSILIPPIGRILEALGRVVRVRQAKEGSIYYTGVAFLEVPKADQEALNDWIERLSRSEKARALIDDASIVRREIQEPSLS